PTASIFVTDSTNANIVDNDTAFRDRNRNDFDMAIRNTIVTQFVVQLSDVGAGIDPSSVSSSQFTLTSTNANGLVMPLVNGVDYTFSYNAATNQVVFFPSAGIWAQNFTYKITLNNNPSGATDAQGNPLPTGILDRADN